MDLSSVQMPLQSSPGSGRAGQIQGGQSRNPSGKQNPANVPSDLRWRHAFLIATSAEGFLSYREEEMRSFYKGWSLTKRMHPHLINTVFLQNSDRMSSWAISGQGRITRTNYQPGSKSVNFSVSVSWRTLMRHWWCCKGTFNNKRASRKKAVKSSNIKEKMVCQ